MAQYGKISGTITDNQGNPVSGATVEVRRQGAFVTSTQAGPTYTVNDPGGIVVGDQVRPNALSGPSRNVSAVTATTLTTSGPGLGTLNNNDRITIFSALPTLYADAQGSETKANPLTTDASGFWFAWAQIRPYDIIETYGSTVRLKTDLVPEGQENVLSNLFSGAGVIAWLKNTVRTLTAGYLFDYQNNGTTKIRGDYAGNLELAGNLTAVDATLSGNLALTGDLTVDDITADDVSFGDLTVSGAVSLPAGSIETADLAANAVVATRVGTGTTDFVVTAGAAFADVTGATVTFTPFSSASEIDITAVTPGEGAGAGNFFLYARIVDGTAATVYHESAANQSAAGTANSPMTVTNIARVTGLTGPQTFKVQAKCTTTNVNILSSSTDRKCRIVVREYKK